MRYINKIDSENGVLLTIDDGPSQICTPLLLDVLRKHNAKANFFMSGANCINNYDLLTLVNESGHAIHSHGFQHLNYTTLSEAEILIELNNSDSILSKYFVDRGNGKCLRLPYGAGFNDSRVLESINKWNPNILLTGWSYSFSEWDYINSINSPSSIVSTVDKLFKNIQDVDFRGKVILLHDWDVFIPHEAIQKSNFRPYYCATILDRLLLRLNELKLTTYLI